MRFHISAFASAFEANDQETHCTFLAGFALRFRLMIFADCPSDTEVYCPAAQSSIASC